MAETGNYIYLGAMDDVVYRYPWAADWSADAARRQMIAAVIHDQTIVINDGYLAAHPAWAQEMNRFDKSIIGHLSNSGRAVVFSRARGDGTNLVEGITKNAPRIRTHKRIVEEWENNPQSREAFEHASKTLMKNCITWPENNMSALFFSLMKEVRGLEGNARSEMVPSSLNREFDELFDRFERNCEWPDCHAARTVWETQAWQLIAQKDVEPHQISKMDKLADRRKKFGDHYRQITSLMNIANEAYHLAYAIGVGEATKSDQRAPGVTTSLCKAFPDLVDLDENEAELDTSIVEGLNRLKIVVPDRLQFKPDYSFLISMEMNLEFCELRRRYLDAVDQYVNGKLDLHVALASRTAYVNHLALLFAPHVILSLPERTLDAFVLAVEKAFEYGAQTITQIASRVAGIDTVEDSMRKRVFRRFVRWRVEQGFGSEVVVHNQSAPPGTLIRQYGLYSGSLNKAACERRMENIPKYAQL